MKQEGVIALIRESIRLGFLVSSVDETSMRLLAPDGVQVYIIAAPGSLTPALLERTLRAQDEPLETAPLLARGMQNLAASMARTMTGEE